MKNKNTYKNGTLTFISYARKDEGTFVVGCDQLCLLVEETDAELAKWKALEKAKSYLRNVIANDLGEHLLNQALPNEIWSEFVAYVSVEIGKTAHDSDGFEKWRTPISELIAA